LKLICIFLLPIAAFSLKYVTCNLAQCFICLSRSLHCNSGWHSYPTCVSACKQKTSLHIEFGQASAHAMTTFVLNKCCFPCGCWAGDTEHAPPISLMGFDEALLDRQVPISPQQKQKVGVWMLCLRWQM